MSLLTAQLDADLLGVINADIPKVITIGSNVVTGLVEEVHREEKDEFGGYNMQLSTRLWIRTATVTNPVTIGSVITVDGALKRVMSWNKALDDNCWIIDVDNPG